MQPFKLAMITAMLCSAGLALADVPTLRSGFVGYTLEIPYLEYGSGASKIAISLNMDSRDLTSFALNAASIRSVALQSAASDVPVVFATGSSYRVSFPYMEFANGASRTPISVALTSTDLKTFAVDAASLKLIKSASSLSAPKNVTVSNSGSQTVSGRTLTSSSKLAVSWQAPGDFTVDHYEIAAAENLMGTIISSSAKSTETTATLTGLKASTPYTVTVKACRDAACSQSGSAAGSGTTSEEYWQLQGSGNTVSGLSKVVSDGNSRISATRFGPEAGGNTASRIQLYYGPFGNTAPNLQSALVVAVTSAATSTSNPASYLSFTSLASNSGLLKPSTASTLVGAPATGQGVPLSSGKVRLFFEAQGSDGKTRVMSVDSQDGYDGRDFNSGSATTCGTTADYSSGGGCAPTVAIGVQGDSVRPNDKISNARQFKLGFPILNDWRWDSAAGTFMVFTTDQVTGCATTGMNHGYAVWDGSNWNVQYEANGCPKLFKSAQAMFPMHVGGVRYKAYFGDPSVTTGRLTTTGSGPGLPFLGPKKLIYADGASTGSAATVDYEDWESVSAGRDVIFLWPNGDKLNDTAEGYIDDYHFLAPTASLDLQVMYMAITDGTVAPFSAAAVLLNP